VNANDISFPNGNIDYSKVHDRVVAIDPLTMTVMINLINGLSSPWWNSREAAQDLVRERGARRKSTPVIYNDAQQSYRGKSCPPFGLRRRGPREFHHGLLALESRSGTCRWTGVFLWEPRSSTTP
jgi:hypothetical protein